MLTKTEARGNKPKQSTSLGPWKTSIWPPKSPAQSPTSRREKESCWGLATWRKHTTDGHLTMRAAERKQSPVSSRESLLHPTPWPTISSPWLGQIMQERWNHKYAIHNSCRGWQCGRGQSQDLREATLQKLFEVIVPPGHLKGEDALVRVDANMHQCFQTAHRHTLYCLDMVPNQKNIGYTFVPLPLTAPTTSQWVPMLSENNFPNKF